jgi:hypothetical protein
MSSYISMMVFRIGVILSLPNQMIKSAFHRRRSFVRGLVNRCSLANTSELFLTRCGGEQTSNRTGPQNSVRYNVASNVYRFGCTNQQQQHNDGRLYPKYRSCSTGLGSALPRNCGLSELTARTSPQEPHLARGVQDSWTQPSGLARWLRGLRGS